MDKSEKFQELLEVTDMAFKIMNYTALNPTYNHAMHEASVNVVEGLLVQITGEYKDKPIANFLMSDCDSASGGIRNSLSFWFWAQGLASQNLSWANRVPQFK